eukprot:TRINITY_DN79_c0_g1_i1.p1 TRINITY_DN79_c0_g1~~TRINITY_DN79_c0_g1_i1.p1  ORF type:complete len:365 (+),score=134.69 TRINITY_DN79_c0_g1_i1:67-1161(+)
MRAATAVLALATAATARKTGWEELRERPSYSFSDYEAEYGKRYEAGERARREAIFNANLAKVRAHNADDSATWKMGLNKFADWTPEEFRRLSKGARGPRTPPSPPQGLLSQPVSDLPASVDWRTKNVVTPVKDQGGCGSCWAFSATETLESAVAIATGKLMVLSEQQVVSCSPNPQQCGGSGGCDGSTQPLAFNYTEQVGLSLESSYKYQGVTGKCSQNKIKPVAINTGYVSLPVNDYTALMNAVAKVGPVAISAAAEPWQLYDSGIFSSKSCGYDMDHGIQLVGYGTEGSQGYWIVRNSWGAYWGEKGYIRIARYGEGKEPCGMDNTPQDGDACKGDTKPRKYCGECGILSSSSYPTGAKLVQ